VLLDCMRPLRLRSADGRRAPYWHMAGTSMGGSCNHNASRGFRRAWLLITLDAETTKSALAPKELAPARSPVPRVTEQPSDHRFHEASSGWRIAAGCKTLVRAWCLMYAPRCSGAATISSRLPRRI